MSATSSPLLDENSQNNNFSDPFGRDDMVDGSTAFTLSGSYNSNILLSYCSKLNAPDTLETFFGSHVDLLQRRLQRHSDRLKSKADEVLRRRNSSSPGENVIANLEREAKAFQLKVVLTCLLIRTGLAHFDSFQGFFPYDATC